MEILYYYLIIAMSFSFMFVLRFGIETIHTTLELLELFNIDRTQEGTWLPIIYIIDMFISVTISMPFVLYGIMVNDRYTVIKQLSTDILIDHFDFKN